MGLFGNLLGTIAGGIGSKFMPLPGVDGAAIGGTVGGLLPFRKGGRIPGRRGKARLIVAHNGEFILPLGVAPTKAQKAAVARRRRKK